MREKKTNVRTATVETSHAPGAAGPEAPRAASEDTVAATPAVPVEALAAVERATDGAGSPDDSKSSAAAGLAAQAPGEAAPPVQAPATPLSPVQLEALRAKAAKADEYWERLLRVSADFENYKKRAARERQEALQFANQSLLQKLLPVMDNFEAALAATNHDANPAVEALKKGIALIQSQLRAVLAEAGLEEIDATGRPFDPNLHEAVAQQESADQPEGQVLQQLRKGYKLRERLVRPASVVVAKKPANA